MSTKEINEAQRLLDQQIADYRAESPEDWADIDRAQAALNRLIEQRRALPLDLADLCRRIHRANELHPEGPSLAALGEEFGEVCRALEESPERLAEELLDVAVVALRWHMQEVGRCR